uniref:Conserved oligomeric Golgi complex subunit 2 n=1 Tax=Culicoides sonorensis TaxID=179676 RepID=A0A336N970_CULSO
MGGDTFNLPVGPSDLCFDTSEFMKESFSADEFLHNYRNAASLEQMRDDLGMYLKVLRNSMIELINADYQDFVNLSAELVDLDKRIEDIRSPIVQLRSDILEVKSMLSGTMNEISECLEKKREIRMKQIASEEIRRLTEKIGKVKDQLSSANENQDSLLNLLERLSLDVVQLEFVVKLHEKHISESMKKDANEIKSLLLEKLKECFLHSIEHHDKKSIGRCLKIYLMLNEIRNAEVTYRQFVVIPKMSNIITESNLQNDPQGLVGIYAKIIEFLETKLSILLSITSSNPNFKDFDFLINSFWTEVEQRIELSMNSIFAPGNPDQFHKKFTSTLSFLDTIEKYAKDSSVIKDHTQYKSFMDKWNLSVYFLIRFQKIGASIETVCSKNLNELFISDQNNFKLEPFLCTINSITTSWSEDVYLPQLFNRFFKLTLQLISRLCTWVDQVLETDKFECDNISQSTYLMMIYLDIVTFMREFPKILETIVKKASKPFVTQRQLLENCFNESKKSLCTRLTQIELKVAQDLIANSAPYLKQVNDIPRLYRKTNREIPTKNCAYVDHTLAATKEFHEKYNKSIGMEKVSQFLINIFTELTDQYYNAITEVLTSVQKTEESLRRLKNLREKGGSGTAAATRQGMSDDDKIRLQLQVDVIYWTNEIETFGITKSQVKKLLELIKFVEDATKIHVADDK